MKRARLPLALLLVVAAAAAAGAAWWWPRNRLPATESFVIAEIVEPDGPPAGLVVLLSDEDGYGRADEALARSLAGLGALVVGIDTPKSFVRVEAQRPKSAVDDCIYFVGEVEQISQETQKQVGDQLYRNPLIVGVRGGASFALALAAQTPDASIGGTIAVDPGATLPLRRELCTDAPHGGVAGVWTYGLEDGRNPDPITVVSTPKADPAGRSHVADIVRAGHVIDTQSTGDLPEAALADAVAAALRKAREADTALLGDLPLSVLPAAVPAGTMAIVLSGDGGWRDLDREIARVLARNGVPTVGIDSLRYFWSEKPPRRIAADLARIVDVYGKMWTANRVALIGFSFGADVLPGSFDAMPKAEQDKVALVSLLSPTGEADYEFHVAGLVSGWFGLAAEGTHSYLPQLKTMPLDRVQCFYGAEDADSVCKELAGTGADIVETAGGHHFDGDYAAVAARILKRLQ